MQNPWDVIIVGAGASGLMCAREAGLRGLRVMLLEHGPSAGRKILISGGGRCNFTNLNTTASNYLSSNPHFCKSALARYTPHDFLALLRKHRIEWVEKDVGQLFCSHRASRILDMLLKECRDAGVHLRFKTAVRQVEQASSKGFELDLGDGQTTACRSLVIATGGLSLPKLGASPFAYKLAGQFGLELVAPRAGLVPFTLPAERREELSSLAGVSLDVKVACERRQWSGPMLFTHRGLSGPALLQLSSYWTPGEALLLDLLPMLDLKKELRQRQRTEAKRHLGTVLADWLPKRAIPVLVGSMNTLPLSQLSTAKLEELHSRLKAWRLKPAGTEGYRTAEVTLGGVHCKELSSRNMEARKVPGLYFIGEAVDVTGQLGGYNFQWAWSSGWCAGKEC